MGGASIAVASFVTITAAVAAFVISQQQPPTYAARADIVFQPAQSGSGLEATRLMTTQTLILKSRAITTPVAEEAGIAVEEIERSLTVDVVGQSNVMRLTVTDSDPAIALQLASAITEGYVRSVGEGTDNNLAKAKALLERQIAQLTTELGAIETNLARSSGPPDTTAGEGEQQLRGEAQALGQRIGILQDRLVDVDVDRVTAARASIVTPAHRLPNPIAPTPLRSAAAGALVGLMLALLTVLPIVGWRARS